MHPRLSATIAARAMCAGEKTRAAKLGEVSEPAVREVREVVDGMQETVESRREPGERHGERREGVQGTVRCTGEARGRGSERLSSAREGAEEGTTERGGLERVESSLQGGEKDEMKKWACSACTCLDENSGQSVVWHRIRIAHRVLTSIESLASALEAPPATLHRPLGYLERRHCAICPTVHRDRSSVHLARVRRGRAVLVKRERRAIDVDERDRQYGINAFSDVTTWAPVLLALNSQYRVIAEPHARLYSAARVGSGRCSTCAPPLPLITEDEQRKARDNGMSILCRAISSSSREKPPPSYARPMNELHLRFPFAHVAATSSLVLMLRRLTSAPSHTRPPRSPEFQRPQLGASITLIDAAYGGMENFVTQPRYVKARAFTTVLYSLSSARAKTRRCSCLHLESVSFILLSPRYSKIPLIRNRRLVHLTTTRPDQTDCLHAPAEHPSLSSLFVLLTPYTHLRIHRRLLHSSKCGPVLHRNHGLRVKTYKLYPQHLVQAPPFSTLTALPLNQTARYSHPRVTAYRVRHGRAVGVLPTREFRWERPELVRGRECVGKRRKKGNAKSGTGPGKQLYASDQHLAVLLDSALDASGPGEPVLCKLEDVSAEEERGADDG
ncbi:hypothetical protein C8Q74DRAFT_1214274 [Fomes fomentarius]|nr:hypothetical protein C8Q74DRAFT_1214274 [Fomes fomentarius]